MSKDILKKAGIFAGIALFFLGLSYAFVPQVLSGKIINQSDITGYTNMSHETVTWNAGHPQDPAKWTDAMFGGMPTTSFQQYHDGDWTHPLYKVLMLAKRPASFLFISLVGAFLLMLSLGIDVLVSVVGAIAVTFCSYNLQIIQVGHNTKMQALAFLPWVLAALIFTYKSAVKDLDGKASSAWREWLPKTLLGAVLFGLALSLQIKANHQQITYYLALMIAVYVVWLFLTLVTGKETRHKAGRFFAASGLLLVIGLFGIGTNAVTLAPLYEYTPYTMRGGSELSHPEGKTINADGLQLDYATAWSYGWEELPNLLIPNFNGGSSSGAVNPGKSEVVKLFRQAGQGNANEMAKHLPLYWGPQPFTAGPMYMGAITVFLFLLGLFLYKGKEKWWLLAATVLAVFLGLGSNMMWFTKLFFDHVPMYNKFRTVSMAITVLQFTLPMLGFLVLDRILKQEYSRKEFLKEGWPALALSAGFCLVMALIPGLAGSFTGGSDSQMQDVVVEALRADRRHLLVSDSLTSMLFILASFGLLLWSFAPTGKKTGIPRRTVAAAGIGILVAVNLFTVGHRYLGKDDFVTPKQWKGHFNARTVDNLIFEDKSPSYRVLDLTSDIFNDNFVSYHHKNIGGYSPAKLQRYQDLIDRHLMPELKTLYSALNSAMKEATSQEDLEAAVPSLPLLDALNLKYIIYNGDSAPIENPSAFGTAWFVDGFAPASSPDEEIEKIGTVDLRTTAVVGKDFEEFIVPAAAPADSSAAIEMVSYSPNELRYRYRTTVPRTAVFSEIYYPKGWHAEIDGINLPLFRADWIFRAANLPSGEHEIVMRYDPAVYTGSARVSMASSAGLLLFLLLALAGMFIPGGKPGSEGAGKD